MIPVAEGVLFGFDFDSVGTQANNLLCSEATTRFCVARVHESRPLYHVHDYS